jgi:demethylmenaquinone methyltransferase / 2-methoxy-6-polyprenyl-1,4-benzoquinol methylase
MVLPEKTSSTELNSSTSWNDDLLKDPHSVEDKRRRVQKMFAAIAPSYDLNNRLHSLWMDQRWRWSAVKLANVSPSDKIVDVACGTGDLTIKFAQMLFLNTDESDGYSEPCRGQIIGVDFTFPMLPVARKKAHKAWVCDEYFDVPSPVSKISIWLNGDAQSLPLSDSSVDIVSIAFGIRNVQDPAKALSEFRRVLRPGGRLIILEFSLPTNPILRGLYNFYFRQVLPRTATLISGDKTGAYKYLPESVNTFIGRQQMMEMMRAAGFEQVEQFPMTFGVCVCYRGVVGG